MAFRVFRILVGAAFALLAAWLVGTGGQQLYSALKEGAAAMALIAPALRILAGLGVVAVFYYALCTSSGLRRNLENIFSIPELLKKLIFTIALLCIYRIGFHVPLPGLDQQKVASFMSGQAGEKGVFGQAIQLHGMLTGGDLSRAVLFGLGIMPYISASIIIQLLTTVWPALERLQKEGPAGYKKIQEYTRYLTVALCIVQAVVFMRIMFGQNLVDPDIYYEHGTKIFLMGVIGLTAGTIFLMWLGEQIDEYGIGNGISLLIMAGIVARMPSAIGQLITQADFSLAAIGQDGVIGPEKMVFLLFAFVFVVSGAILITQGQRRIPIQQAKMTRGRRVYGGQRQYLPLRVNHGGVMPIIFASSLMIFPGTLFRWLNKSYGTPGSILELLDRAFLPGSYTYQICYIGMIFFFAYFWTTVQFRPREMADQLRDSGSFIPGLRPGRRTAEYLERVMERITYCGAAFLALIAVIPMAISSLLKIPFGISSFLGGTGLLIIISVALDLVQRIEANLVMRNYGGFLGGSARIKGAYR